MNDHLRITDKMVDLIKKWEGFRSHAYKDSVGVWTVGYGTTTRGNVGITVGPSTRLTVQDADKYLRVYLEREMKAVKKLLKVRVTQHEMNAIMSFVYNLGIANFKRSSVLKFLNAGMRKEAADAFLMWNKARVKGKLVVLKGLDNRRRDERAMFLAAKAKDVLVEPEKEVKSAQRNVFVILMDAIRKAFQK